MKIGTKSLLFGVHQVVLHPIILFIAWWQVYGFPADPRLWIAFVIHDWGYWGKPNMDGSEGEKHVEWAANVMRRWFGDEWGDFCLYHSRFYSKRDNRHFSKLCVADKWLIAIEPWWLYLPRATASGEFKEYMQVGRDKSGKYGGIHNEIDAKGWYLGIQKYCRNWVGEHKDMRDDTWTGNQTETMKNA